MARKKGCCTLQRFPSGYCSRAAVSPDFRIQSPAAGIFHCRNCLPYQPSSAHLICHSLFLPFSPFSQLPLQYPMCIITNKFLFFKSFLLNLLYFYLLFTVYSHFFCIVIIVLEKEFSKLCCNGFITHIDKFFHNSPGGHAGALLIFTVRYHP